MIKLICVEVFKGRVIMMKVLLIIVFFMYKIVYRFFVNSINIGFILFI